MTAEGSTVADAAPVEERISGDGVIRSRIREFAASTFLLGAGEVDADTDLFEANYIDSFGFVDLVSFLEQTFGIVIEEDDLTSPEMATLAGIERVVVSKLAHKDAP